MSFQYVTTAAKKPRRIDDVSEERTSPRPLPKSASRTDLRPKAMDDAMPAAEGPAQPKRSRGHRSPTQQSILSKALSMANTAVLHDNLSETEGAIEAYAEACELLQQVMVRSSDMDDRKKLSAIRQTYSNRIAELHDLDDTFASLMDKDLPENPLTLDANATFFEGASGPSTVEALEQVHSPPRGESLLPQIFGGEQNLDDSTVAQTRKKLRPLFKPSNLEVPMETQYIPLPLSPRRVISPPPSEPPSQAPPEHPKGASTMPRPIRRTSTESTSWLDTSVDDESLYSSSYKSLVSRRSAMRQQLSDNSMADEIEAEFHAAVDAAVDAAYDSDDLVDLDDTPRVEQRNQLFESRVPLRVTDQQMSNWSEHGRANSDLDATQDYLDEDTTEQKERLLDEMTQGYTFDDFRFDHKSKSALPRQSDSSTFPGQTQSSSNQSATMTAGTTLSTLAEANKPPKPAPIKDTPLPPPPAPDSMSSPVSTLQPISPQQGPEHLSAINLRDRRLSRLNALKIEMYAPTRGTAQALLKVPPKIEIPPPADIQKALPPPGPPSTGAVPITLLASIHSNESQARESPATPTLTQGGSRNSMDENTAPSSSPAKLTKMMPPPAVVRKNLSSTSLGQKNLSISAANDEQSPMRPGSAVAPGVGIDTMNTTLSPAAEVPAERSWTLDQDFVVREGELGKVNFDPVSHGLHDEPDAPRIDVHEYQGSLTPEPARHALYKELSKVTDAELPDTSRHKERPREQSPHIAHNYSGAEDVSESLCPRVFSYNGSISATAVGSSSEYAGNTFIASSEDVAVDADTVANRKEAMDLDATGRGDAGLIEDGVISVVSDPADISSLKIIRRTPEMVTAEQHIGDVLGSRPELVEICRAVRSRTTESKFVNNLRRLLKVYFVGLLESAKSNLESATCNLLRSHYARIRIASAIWDSIDPNLTGHYDEPQVNENLLTARTKLLDLERWIAGNPSLNQDPANSSLEEAEPLDDFETLSEPDSIGSDFGDEEDIFTELPNVLQMEQFLVTGGAFQKLLVGLYVSTLPRKLSSMTRVLLTVPVVAFLESVEKPSLIDEAKLWIESKTAQTWCWWPFQAPIRSLKGDCRIQWTCHCGEVLYADVNAEDAERFRTLLRLRGDMTMGDHLCKNRLRYPRMSVDFVTGLSNTVLSLGSELAAHFKTAVMNATSGASAQATGSSPAGTSNSQQSQAVGRAAMGAGGPSAAATLASAPANSQIVTSPQNQLVTIPLDSNRYILLGLEAGGWDFKLRHIRIDTDNPQVYHDGLLFRTLVEKYKEMRGRWALLTSIWQLDYCDFIKFEKYRAGMIAPRGHALPKPPGTDYEYDPRAPNAEEPPVSKHEFRSSFSVCSNPCSWAFFHRCLGPPRDCFATKRIPKKITEWELLTETRGEAFGLKVHLEMSAFRVVLYHVFMLLGTLVFWLVWQIKNPDDQSTAAAPAAFMASLLSLFWTVAAYLPHPAAK